MLKKEKILLLGDGAVGKTSLVRKFVHDEFDDKYITTMGAKITKKVLRLQGNAIVLQIWDVLGQQGYSQVHSKCFKGATGAIMVIDITRMDTLMSLERYWLQRLYQSAGNIPAILVANKADLTPDPWLMKSDLFKATKTARPAVMLTSAKTGMNVEMCFKRLGEELLLNWKRTLIPKKRPVRRNTANTPLEAADMILADLCDTTGDVAYAMSLIHWQFRLTGADIRSPTMESLYSVVELLHKQEMEKLGDVAAFQKKMERIAILKRLGSAQTCGQQTRAEGSLRIRPELRRKEVPATEDDPGTETANAAPPVPLPTPPRAHRLH